MSQTVPLEELTFVSNNVIKVVVLKDAVNDDIENKEITIHIRCRNISYTEVAKINKEIKNDPRAGKYVLQFAVDSNRTYLYPHESKEEIERIEHKILFGTSEADNSVF